MRSLILMSLMAAVALPSAASAQSRAEIRHDRREVREEQRDLRQARRSGDRQDIRRERRDVREARQELREDRAHRRAVRYSAPYGGWQYRPVAVGYHLHPLFYSSRYYAAGMPQYRIGRFQQWIRDGDDLLLVNVRNGRVIQVVRNYFW